MAHLFVPPSVARELLDERQQFTAAVKRACYTDRVCQEWNRELQRLDPLLSMVRAPEYFVIGTPLLPGHYHWIRDNPNTMPTVTPISGPNGEFIYPPGNLLERLKGMDLQDVRVRLAQLEGQRRAEAEQEKYRERLREERREELTERVKAARDVRVSFSPDERWTQNMSPAARRDVATRRKAG